MNEFSNLFSGGSGAEVFSQEEKEAVWMAGEDFDYDKSDPDDWKITNDYDEFEFKRKQGVLTANKKDNKAKRKFKLDVFKTLAAADRKDRGYYDRLTDEEKKGFAPVVLARWMSIVNSSNSDLEEWYLLATNLRANMKQLQLKVGDVGHPKLQWLMFTAAGPNFGKVKHEWIPFKTAGQTLNKLENVFWEHYPLLNEQEIKMLVKWHDKKEIRAFLKETGMNDKEIQKLIRLV